MGNVTGHYIRKYTCDDQSDLSVDTFITRTFVVVDNNPPVITVVPRDQQEVKLAASVTEGYTDAGAECRDQAINMDDASNAADHTNLDSMVVVGGDIVDRKTPGTYVVTYDCTDRKGNDGIQKKRTIVVSDEVAPWLNRTGKGTEYVEAGHEYVDQGAIASDNIDGWITDKVVTTGNQVNTIKAFAAKRSCAEIKYSYPAAESGDYWIATYITSTLQWVQTKVYCDMPVSGAAHTYKLVTSDHRCTVYQSQQCACTKHGLDMPVYDDTLKALASKLRFKRFIPTTFNPADNEKQYTYVCALNNEGRNRQLNPHPITMDSVSHAMPGEYVIKYTVTDSAGNSAVSDPNEHWRTVIVKDTLKPVITLHLAGQMVHKSAGGTGEVLYGSKSNPAEVKGVNPHLDDGYSSSLNTKVMARSSVLEDGGVQKTQDLYVRSHNDANYAADSMGGDWQQDISMMAEHAPATTSSWLLASATAAVAGLALLAHSQRRQGVVVSVPV